MAIDVICTGCHARFQVSDKFAGKKGPCPKCKAIIMVPTKQEEIVVHAPKDSGPTDAKGVSVLKPITRTETKFSMPVAIGVGIGIVAVLVLALVLRLSFHGDVPLPILIVGSLLLAPPLAYAGYTFLREDELEPYRGTSLLLRLIPPTLVYPALWGIYWLVIATLNPVPEMMLTIAVIVVPAVVAAGAFTAQVSLDLSFGSGAMHYGMYLVTTIVLRIIMGMSAYLAVGS